MIKRILVGLAGTPYTPVAVRRAVLTAQAHGAAVGGVTLFDSLRSPDDEARSEPFLSRITVEHVERAVAHFENECRAAGVPYQVHRERSEPFSALMDLSRYHDMVVLGLKGLFEHRLPATDPEALLLQLGTAGVRPILAETSEYRPVSRVLVACNGSADSANALKHFVLMRLWPDAVLKIMTFVHHAEKGRRLVEDASAYCRAHGYKTETHVDPGDPALLLLPTAGLWGADLIVMGSGARSMLVRRALGDMALEAIRHSRIALFLCH